MNNSFLAPFNFCSFILTIKRINPAKKGYELVVDRLSNP
jgi:hypothetical protein